MDRTTFFRSADLTIFFSLPSRPSSLDQNTKKLPILALLFLAQAASSFLANFSTSGVAWRAKTMATGLPPLEQYRQNFLPAAAPLMLSGWNGPANSSPSCGLDLTFLSSAMAELRNRATARPRAP